MSAPARSHLTVLYDGDCGFCMVMVAALLRWDRARRLHPLPIQGEQGEELLADMSPAERLESWHVLDGERTLRSGGAAIPVALAVLPAGTPLAWLTGRFPRATSDAYEWVADHRRLLGGLFGARARAWAMRVIDARERRDQTGR